MTEAELDPDRIDDAVPALINLGLHHGCRTWKGFDCEAIDRLYERGMIAKPAGKTRSVVFTEDGLRRSTIAR